MLLPQRRQRFCLCQACSKWPTKYQRQSHIQSIWLLLGPMAFHAGRYIMTLTHNKDYRHRNTHSKTHSWNTQLYYKRFPYLFSSLHLYFNWNLIFHLFYFHTENSNQLFGLSLKKYFKHPKYFIQPFSPSSVFTFLLLFNWIDLLDGTNFFAPCLPSASILNLFVDCLFGEFICLTWDIGFLLNAFLPSKRESM